MTRSPQPDTAHLLRAPVDRKLHQMCGQVRRALEMALAADISDPVVGELYIESVEPFPGSRRLQVTVRHWDPECGLTRRDILARLGRAKGLLRSRVATALNRTRTPELVFEVQLPGSQPLPTPTSNEE